jgi:PadR family transcriptional regulator, regulatory protein PadR
MQPLTRVTAATIDVLRAFESAGEPYWGLLVIKSSGRPAGSVYPILERLEQLGWVTSRWEDDDSRPGPRRRYYELTEEGAAAARVAIGAFRPRPTPAKATTLGATTGVTA